MYIIFGASGQVGSAVVANLLNQGKKVKAVVHSANKAASFKEQGAETAVADVNDKQTLISAYQGGETVFIITPETGQTQNLIAETEQQLANHRAAAEIAGIKTIVGLSSYGAHLGRGTGNLEMSYLLEHAFEGLPATQVFIRPAYYFSNWLMGIEQVRETGVLPTFFPPEKQISMIAPTDVAGIVAEVLIKDHTEDAIYEIEAPARYSANDVVAALAKVLNKPVNTNQIPRDQWEITMQQVGFTPDGVKHFVRMTELVVNGDTDPEGGDNISLKGETTLEAFIDNALK